MARSPVAEKAFICATERQRVLANAEIYEIVQGWRHYRLSHRNTRHVIHQAYNYHQSCWM